MRRRSRFLLLTISPLPTTAVHLHFRGQGRHWYSRDAEDEHVFRRFFSNGTEPPFTLNGTFVELGAADGSSISNSLFFERELGWSGLLIEPSSSFDKLSASRGNNPKNTLLREAVCAQGRGHVAFSTPATRDTAGVVEELSSSNWERYHRPQHQRANVSSVPCRPLSAMLREAAITSIDFFSLDVEGGELTVLQTMNWSIPIRVLVVEQDSHNQTKDERVRELLRSHNLHFVHRMGFRSWNELWVDAEFARASGCTCTRQHTCACAGQRSCACAGRSRP